MGRCPNADKQIVDGRTKREDRKVAVARAMEIAHAKQYLSLTRFCGGIERHTYFFLGLEYNFTFARMGIP